MKRALVIGILASAFFGGWLRAQQTILWQRCLGGSADDEASSVIQTSDGGFALAGATRSNDGDFVGNHGHQDGWVVKLNSSGATQWSKCYGGTSDDDFFSIIQTSDGGFAVAGATNSDDDDVSGNHGNTDSWVVKLDNTGNIEWQKCLGGSSR